MLLPVGRQFPDKAIDLIDEACANTRMQIDNHREVNITTMQIDSQEEVNTVQNISANAVKEAIVGPDHVAQVGILNDICVNTFGYFNVMCLLCSDVI